MNSKLNMIKNIGWAIGIVICLLALLVALFVGSFTRYGGERERGTLALGAEPVSEPASEIYVVGNTGELPAAAAEELPETADGGQSYIDSLTFLCDSTTIGLRDYSLVGVQQVWGSETGSLPVGSLADCRIRYPGDGSSISPADAAMIVRPSRLIVSLGADGLSQVDRDTFTQQYTALLQSIRDASPDTTIVCLSLCPVVGGYAGADGLTAAMIAEANEWLRTLSLDMGLIYADAASVVRDSSGSLMSEYASANGKTLNSAGMYRILDFLRTHVV